MLDYRPRASLRSGRVAAVFSDGPCFLFEGWSVVIDWRVGNAGEVDDTIYV